MLKVLFVNDSASDFKLVQTRLSRSKQALFLVEWASSFDLAWEHISASHHDACIISPKIGSSNGIELVRNARSSGLNTPMVVLADAPNALTDMQAMMAGATYYLEKSSSHDHIERTLRYAVTRHRAIQDIQRTVLRDPLTGLATRTAARERIQEAIGRARRTGTKFAFLYVNVSGFRKINREKGHAVGDAVLREIGARLLKLRRAQDMAARIGGDEFLFLADELEAVDDAHQLLNSVNNALRAPFTIGKMRTTLRIPMGAVTFPEDGDDLETLVKRADTAMRRANDRQEELIEFWSKARHMKFRSSQEMLASLAGALERGDFVLHYQPVFWTSSRDIIGCEALLRWQHMDHGLVTPREFLKALEQTEYVHEVGQWVMGKAVELVAEARQRYGITLRVCVNVSGRELLHVGLPARLQRLLDKHNLPPRQLQIEVSELTLEDRLSAIEPALEELRAVGVKVALDGFGKSRCTLDALMGPRWDGIKLGASMLSKMGESRQRMHVLEGVIQMWKALGCEVWADAVETTRDSETLQRFGCDFVQGYAHGGPLSRDRMLALIADQTNK